MGFTRTVAAVVVTASAALLNACGSADTRATTAGATPAVQPPGWTRIHDRRNSLQIAFPSSWQRARRSLTPYLSEPREILSIGTGPLVVAPGECAHMPTGALARMRPADALISIQERRMPGQATAPRPARFRLGTANRSEAAACLSDPARLDTWFLGFRERGRAFYALVALGRPVSAARRRVAERVLDSLRLTSDRPGGAG